VIYLLETSTCSALMRRHPRCVARLERLSPTDEMLICPITRGEILYGLARLPVGRRREALTADAQRLFALIPCVPVPKHAGDAYADLKRQAEQRGVAISENDLWIAATAVTLDAILVAADQDFGRLSDVRVEDWTRAN
jgi:tRNA(fMet)-specific endonuclease VapC